MDWVTVLLIFIFFILPLIQQVMEHSRRGRANPPVELEGDEEEALDQELPRRPGTPPSAGTGAAERMGGGSWSDDWAAWPESVEIEAEPARAEAENRERERQAEPVHLEVRRPEPVAERQQMERRDRERQELERLDSARREGELRDAGRESARRDAERRVSDGWRLEKVAPPEPIVVRGPTGPATPPPRAPERARSRAPVAAGRSAAQGRRPAAGAVRAPPVAPPAETASSRAAGLARVLSSSGGGRNAIVLAEVLGPPLALKGEEAGTRS